ncbi:amino acid ABC transporter substrate-binding protein [Pseudomonas indoloxydans]|uniref:Amino acid ABC transporter substrate-binding protein n=1 Tax=Ectopseudomonas oleovorans TaxID=301 RepID=A0A2T5PIQ3_ECTOL|nr:FecR family protein [Pseudomonas indoloxydans]PTU77601.1 amino acid ABC transporter substrate-binding protein [Pseudomonas indoloxydans]
MSQVSARVLDEAIAWQLCLDSGEDSEQQRHDFADWLAAHPEHSLVWQRLGGIDQQLSAASAPMARRALLQSSVSRRRSLRRIGGSALSLLLAAGVTLVLMAQQRPLGDYLADYHTASGEQRDLLLADRSQVRLNSRSALDIEFDENERRLHLRSGEILVQTAKGDTRPFIVETEQGRLRALGTRFLVRREGTATELIVLQSAVAARPLASSQERIIHSGEQVRMDSQHLSASHPAPIGADAWSRGMLVADNLPLQRLIDQLGEYRSGYLSLDPSLADLRISGSFPLHDSDKALAAVALSLPVRTEQLSPWWTRVLPAEK